MGNYYKNLLLNSIKKCDKKTLEKSRVLSCRQPDLNRYGVAPEGF